MLLEPFFSATLHDERGGSNQMLLEQCFSVTLLGLCLCMTPQDARGERVLMKCSCS